MKSGKWRARLFRGPADPVLRSWLVEPNSLTARCQRACSSFRVRLVRYGKGRQLADAAKRRPLSLVREVILECDGTPVIFAHTTLSFAERGRMSCWMAGLGTRSLGSLLFSHPGFQRGRLEYVRLDRQHPLFQRVARQCTVGTHLWARRSLHCLDGLSVLVTEVFLPGILDLE